MKKKQFATDWDKGEKVKQRGGGEKRGTRSMRNKAFLYVPPQKST